MQKRNLFSSYSFNIYEGHTYCLNVKPRNIVYFKIVHEFSKSVMTRKMVPDWLHDTHYAENLCHGTAPLKFLRALFLFFGLQFISNESDEDKMKLLQHKRMNVAIEFLS